MSTDVKKVAIYARVSSERQDTDLSISAQLKALREYALRNGHSVVKEYVDEAESGRSIDRPGFKSNDRCREAKGIAVRGDPGVEALEVRAQPRGLDHLQVAAPEARCPGRIGQ